MSTAEHPMDLPGCFWSLLRTAGCLSFLYVVMFLAIVIVGLLAILFY
jgi:hypothetical protein